MKQEYIITNDKLRERGLDLNEYALEGVFVNAIIETALDLVITRILFMNDNFKYETDIETALDENPNLLRPFLKLQYRVIYNLIFVGDSDPLDKTVDDIISYDLRWGKINGFQKGVYR